MFSAPGGGANGSVSGTTVGGTDGCGMTGGVTNGIPGCAGPGNCWAETACGDSTVGTSVSERAHATSGLAAALNKVQRQPSLEFIVPPRNKTQSMAAYEGALYLFYNVREILFL
jgi:hypothetical protein